MKLSDGKLCVNPECEEIVEMHRRACPSCTCTQFVYLTSCIKSLKERAEVDEARRRLKLIGKTA